MKTSNLSVQCTCGKLKGEAKELSPQAVNRAVCYCDDCQSFAHFLGRPDDILDTLGGTEVYQLSPRHFNITEGDEYLACVRLKPKGLHRWYASCCHTPLANTMNGAIPFVALINPCLIGATEETVGPVKMRVFGRYAKGDASAVGAHPKAPMGTVFNILFKLIGRRVRGHHREHDLFDAKSASPRVQPKVLEASRLAEIEAARDRWTPSGSRGTY